MKIIIKPEIYQLLMDIHHLRPKEFSGFGFCTHTKDTVEIYDFVLLDVGSEVFTEIPPEVILPLMDRSDAPNMKVWAHAHPLGTGIPGWENWSGTDNATIRDTPLGGIPELVKWSCSVVLTPHGWVGRVDNYLTHKTIHCEVEPKSNAAALLKAVNERKQKTTVKRTAVQIANYFTDAELAEYGVTREDWTLEIIQGLEDGSLLPENLSYTEWAALEDLGYDPYEFEEEEDEPFETHGPVRRQQYYGQPDWGGRDRRVDRSRPGKDGRHGNRGVRS